MAKAIIEQFSYTEHGRKPVIRLKWCLPQLQTLYTKVKKRMIYIGLPGIEALDIKVWIEYLSKVIAFQCSEYREGRTTKKIDVRVLDKILNDFELQDKLTSSIVYQGFMEDIVMGGLSERGQLYSQEDFVKIYNLDFCSNFTTPREIRDENGKIIYHYKLDVIDELLKYQAAVTNDSASSRFLMYITVNSNIFKGDVSHIKDSVLKTYFKGIKKVTKPEVVATRLMKAYCFYELVTRFNKYNFNVEFLPPIFYQGSEYPNQNNGSQKQFHRMMTFTILGTKMPNGVQLYQQDRNNFLNSKFIFATDKQIQCYSDRFLPDELDFNPDPIKLIQESHTFTQLW